MCSKGGAGEEGGVLRVRRGIDEVPVLVRCNAASLKTGLQAFPDYVLVSSSRFEILLGRFDP
jgi:hypothetical protein